MTITLDLSPTEEAKLTAEAKERGLAPEQLAHTILREGMRSDSADPIDTVYAKLRAWQIETKTEMMPPIEPRPGMTPTQTLFKMWEEEDALKSDEELEKDAQIWEDFKKGIDDERRTQGMRTLFDT